MSNKKKKNVSSDFRYFYIPVIRIISNEFCVKYLRNFAWKSLKWIMSGIYEFSFRTEVTKPSMREYSRLSPVCALIFEKTTGKIETWSLRYIKKCLKRNLKYALLSSEKSFEVGQNESFTGSLTKPGLPPHSS